MIVKTTYDNLQVGENVRFYLEISDLHDSSGNSVHLDQIRKISIEKVDHTHLVADAPNIVARSFYGIKNVKFQAPNSSTDFSKVSDGSGNYVDLAAGGHFVQITNPITLAGYYEISNVLQEDEDASGNSVSRTVVISGVFSDIEKQEMEYKIVDSSRNIIVANSTEDCSLEFNENTDFYAPVWKQDLYYFEDLSQNNFASLPNDISTYTVQISDDGVSYDSYPCSVFHKFSSSSFYGFFIKGFKKPDNYNSSDIYHWKLIDSNGIEVIFPGGTNKSNAVINSLYDSIVNFDNFINDDGDTLFRYYFDWTIEDRPESGDGSYLIYWYVNRESESDSNIQSLEEIFNNDYLIHNDFLVPEIFNRKFNRENYFELLKNYIPFFYLDYQADDVLSQTLQAFGESIFDLQTKVDKFPQLIDPSRCPVQSLPYIANLFSFNLKGNNILNWRQQLVNLPKILKKKGTVDGLTEILSLMDVTVNSIIFYWQVKSPYLWTDYFFVDNNEDIIESHKLTYNPILQFTGTPSQLDFSRYKLEYYSTVKSSWFDLLSTNSDYEFFNLINMKVVDSIKRKNEYSNVVDWNFGAESSYNYYVEHRDLLNLFDINNIDFENDLISYKVNIVSGNVRLGTYSFTLEDIETILDSASGVNNVKIKIRHYGELSTLFLDPGDVSEDIKFDILIDDEVRSEYQNMSGNVIAEEVIRNNPKDLQGRIRGLSLTTNLMEYFIPAEGDIIKIRYQYKEYPFEINASSSDHLINFDNFELCKDDYILSLDLADDRNPIDTSFIDNKLLPLVNYNVRLLPDSNCFVRNDNEDPLVCLDEYKVCDLCSQRNPLHPPLIYGHLRTKFPWSENVYNMDEYDGSTRPSYSPCDIDEDFLDKCGCCWSSYFSMSIAVTNLSNNILSTINDTIDEFKPFHSRLKNLSYSGAFEDNVRIDDDHTSFEVGGKFEELLNLGYYPVDRIAGTSLTKKRSNTHFFANGTFSTTIADLKDGVYLRDNSVAFNEFGIGAKNENQTNPILPTLNTNVSRVVIESPLDSGVHGGKTYNIEIVDNNRLKLVSGDDDTNALLGDLPDPPYTYEGPWTYSIYTRKYPQAASVSPVWPGIETVNITKSGKFVIDSNIGLLSSGSSVVSELTDPLNIYEVIIESGATAGTYGISDIVEDQIVLSNYQLGDPYGGPITFSVYRDGVIIQDLSSVSGTLDREEVYGEFTIGTTDFTEDWAVEVGDSYVCLFFDDYYKIIEINNNLIKFKGYASGSEGSFEISIFNKILSSVTGNINATTDIIHSDGTFDFYNTIYNAAAAEDRVNDFIIGLAIGVNLQYYGIDEIYPASTFKVKLTGLAEDEVLSGEDMSIRLHLLTDYKENTANPETDYPETHVLTSMLNGIATAGGSTTALHDTTVNFNDLYVKVGDIVIYLADNNEDNFRWGIITNINSATQITFTAMAQGGVADIAATFILGSEYRIIRRNIYDYNMDVPKMDIVKVNIDPEFDNFYVPLQMVTELSSPGEYNLEMSSRDKNLDIDVGKTRATDTKKILVGPLDNIPVVYLPIPLSDFRIINKDCADDNCSQLEDQFSFTISSRLIIDGNSTEVYVNDVYFDRVDRWTDPSTAPGLYGRREYISQQVSPNEIRITFGDGLTGARVDPGDILNVSYVYYGSLPGPNTSDQISQHETVFFEITNVFTGSELVVRV